MRLEFFTHVRTLCKLQDVEECGEFVVQPKELRNNNCCYLCVSQKTSMSSGITSFGVLASPSFFIKAYLACSGFLKVALLTQTVLKSLSFSDMVIVDRVSLSVKRKKVVVMSMFFRSFWLPRRCHTCRLSRLGVLGDRLCRHLGSISDGPGRSRRLQRLDRRLSCQPCHQR